MKRLRYIVKYSRLLYTLCYHCASFCIRTLGVFIKTDPYMILFNSFGGRKYDDSPRAIFERMLQDKRYDKYTLVWALDNPSNFELPQRAKIVKDYSLIFFICALKAKVWITNSSMEHGLRFKKAATIYINTWHGSAIKYLGDDIKEEGKSFKSKEGSREDAFFIQGSYDEYVFERAFHKEKAVLKKFGLPRNDELSNFTQDKVLRIKKMLGLDFQRKVILYAPTFREYTRNNGNQIVQDLKIDLSRWENEMGNDYILLIRAHYEVAKNLNISYSLSILDVSSYPHLNDLLIISDALISDYSSIFFDYSILHRPMVCFAYDIDEYTQKRGVYIDLSKELPCNIVQTNNELFPEVRRVFEQYEETYREVVSFQKKYVPEYGSACEKACDYLAKMLE